MMIMKTKPGTQCGFSLVEIMIALTLSLILTAGVIQIMASSRQTYRVADAAARMQENARFAMDFLTRDIRMAGFWGCAQYASTNNLLNPVGAGYINFLSNAGVSGVDGGGALADRFTLTGAYNTGYQILPNVGGVFGPLPSSALQINPGNGLTQGDIVLVSDCSSGDIFQISNATPNNGTLVHDTSAATTPGNVNTGPGCGGGNSHCLSKVYAGDAMLYRIRRIVYSVLPGANGQPALFRSDGANALELVDGVQDMQVLYGEDNNGDGFANDYIPAASVNNMNNVVSLRISLLLRSYRNNITTNAQTYRYMGANILATDKRLRQVYTTTVALRN